MTNEEKAQEICEKNKRFHVECSSLECYLSAMDMAKWKEEQFKQLLIDKAKLLSPSSAQDSVKRCTIEEIYRELFNEEYKIKGWLARDFDGSLTLCKKKPQRYMNDCWVNAEEYFPLGSQIFPELTWEDEPIEVELTIKKI